MAKTIKSPLPWSKEILFSSLLLGGGLILLNLLALLIANWQWPAFRLFEPDRYRGSRLHANLDLKLPTGRMSPKLWRRIGAFHHVTTDARGLRAGRLLPPGTAAPAQVLTVICLGDSYSFGWDVDDEQTYPAQLQGLLQDRMPALSLRVINAAVPAYTARQGLVYLCRELLGFHPDFVIFAFGAHDGMTSDDRMWCPVPGLSDADLMPRVSLGLYQPITLSPIQHLENFFWRLPMVILIRNQSLAVKRIPFIVALVKGEIGKPSPGTAKQCLDCRLPLRDFQNDLIDLVELGRRYQFVPVFVLPFGSAFDYQRATREIQERYRIPLVDISKRFTGFQPEQLNRRPDWQAKFRPYREWLGPENLAQYPMLYLTTDGAHPNTVGNALIAEALAQVIAYPGQELPALPAKP